MKPKTNDSNKNKRIAIAATVIAHLLLLLLLTVSTLNYKWPPDDPPQESEILFGGEYVMVGDVDFKASTDMASAQNTQKNALIYGDDIVDKGSEGEQSEVISTDEQSDMVVKKKEEKPEKKGPTKEELAEQERIKRQREEAEKINRRVTFGNKGKSSGKEGSPAGKETTGKSSGAPGHSLSGRTLESWGHPSSGVDGVVIIQVRVNSRGRVIDARYKGGSGSAAASRAVRESCRTASMQSRFSVSTESTAEQVGTITWRFE